MGGIAVGRFLLKVFEDLLNDRWVFNAGNDFDVTPAVLTDFDIDIEDAFEPLHDFHGWNECRLCMEQKPVQVVARCRSSGLLSSQPLPGGADLFGFLPRFAGVT